MFHPQQRNFLVLNVLSLIHSSKISSSSSAQHLRYVLFLILQLELVSRLSQIYVLDYDLIFLSVEISSEHDSFIFFMKILFHIVFHHSIVCRFNCFHTLLLIYFLFPGDCVHVQNNQQQAYYCKQLSNERNFYYCHILITYIAFDDQFIDVG